MNYSTAPNSWLEPLQALLCLAALSYASYLDLRFREVEPAYWYAWLRVLAPLGFMEVYIQHGSGIPQLPPGHFVVYVLASNAASVIVAYGAYLAGLLGGGDVLALLLIAMGDPITPHTILPPSLLSLLYGSVTALLITLYHCVLNIVKSRALLIELVRRKGVLLGLRACFTAYPLVVKEALRRGWLFPAHWELGKYSVVEADPPELLAQLAEERGLDGTVWVTLGLPQILFIMIGFLASLLLGDKPLQALLLFIKG